MRIAWPSQPLAMPAGLIASLWPPSITKSLLAPLGPICDGWVVATSGVTAKGQSHDRFPLHR